MRRILCSIAFVGLLTCVTFAQTGRPALVARLSLKNQTAPIPTTTIFTPKVDGLYRVSVYMTITTSDPNSGSTWYAGINWTDEAGPESYPQFLFANGYAAPPDAFFQTNQSSFGPSLTIQAKVGTPITYSVGQFGNPDASAYAVFIAVERLF